MFMKAPDVIYFWPCKAPFECSKLELPREAGGMLPREILKKNTQKRFQSFWKPSIGFPGKAGGHSFSLQSKIFNENGQMVWGEGGGMATTEFSVVYHCEVRGTPLYGYSLI